MYLISLTLAMATLHTAISIVTRILLCDQDEGIASAPPQQQSRFRLESRVLKAKDDGPPVPLAIFEPPDPTKRPMYAKHLVYQGRTQFNKIIDTTHPNKI